MKSLFFYLSILTTFFILLEISFFLQGSELYLGDFHLIANHLSIPIKIIPGLLYFLGVQVFLHFLFIVIIMGLSYYSVIGFWQCNDIKKIEKTGIALWLLGILTLLLGNHYFYPNSKFSLLISSIFPNIMAKILFILLLLFFSLVILVAFYGFILSLKKHIKLLSILFISITALFYFFHSSLASQKKIISGTIEKPNIILIGVDALRPDFLSYFGGKKQTLHFDQFLNHAAVFSESFTPIARTYPAWVSILTGEYPKKNHVRFDLSDNMDFTISNTLPNILKNHGYETLFATDETRFSNIDEKFGFNKIITPPIGFNDFLLGTLNDFPFSNLLVNTFLGKYLFPYSYANRPAYVTYNPNSFLNLLAPALSGKQNKPLFLAVHLCLTHYVYVWADFKSTGSPQDDYRAAIQRADKQFYDLLKLLKEKGLLEHSIVVLLSDHGEALELAGDRITDPNLFIPSAGQSKKNIPRFYPASIAEEKVNQSGGHGTDVLGLSQYHNVLAFRFYGVSGEKARSISGHVSLLDIKPTILSALQINNSKSINHDGVALNNAIAGKKININLKKDFFMESDFSPEAVRSAHPETRKVLFEGIDYVQINPKTTRVTIKPSVAKLIISSKQYADLYGEWILALYPQANHKMIPILVNLKTRYWTIDLRTTLAQQAPVSHMQQALKDFYGDEILL